MTLRFNTGFKALFASAALSALVSISTSAQADTKVRTTSFLKRKRLVAEGRRP